MSPTLVYGAAGGGIAAAVCGAAVGFYLIRNRLGRAVTPVLLPPEKREPMPLFPETPVKVKRNAVAPEPLDRRREAWLASSSALTPPGKKIAWGETPEKKQPAAGRAVGPRAPAQLPHHHADAGRWIQRALFSLDDLDEDEYEKDPDAVTGAVWADHAPTGTPGGGGGGQRRAAWSHDAPPAVAAPMALPEEEAERRKKRFARVNKVVPEESGTPERY